MAPGVNQVCHLLEQLAILFFLKGDEFGNLSKTWATSNLASKGACMLNQFNHKSNSGIAAATSEQKINCEFGRNN
jgi:hypothetical protein